MERPVVFSAKSRALVGATTLATCRLVYSMLLAF